MRDPRENGRNQTNKCASVYVAPIDPIWHRSADLLAPIFGTDLQVCTWHRSLADPPIEQPVAPPAAVLRLEAAGLEDATVGEAQLEAPAPQNR